VFNAPTLSRKNLLHFVRGVLQIRKKYRNLLSPPMFDSPRAIRYVYSARQTDSRQMSGDRQAVFPELQQASHMLWW
jgi:hypothetical protein